MKKIIIGVLLVGMMVATCGCGEAAPLAESDTSSAASAQSDKDSSSKKASSGSDSSKESSKQDKTASFKVPDSSSEKDKGSSSENAKKDKDTLKTAANPTEKPGSSGGGSKSGETEKPSPTSKPGGSGGSTPTKAPAPTEKPSGGSGSGTAPTKAPVPTTKAPVVTSKPTAAPQPTAAPTKAPVVTPRPTEKPVPPPVVTEKPAPPPVVTPKPTEKPKVWVVDVPAHYETQINETQVWVDEVGHYEEEGYYEYIHNYQCNGCSAMFNTEDGVLAHQEAEILGGNMNCGSYTYMGVSGSTWIVTGQKWVVDVAGHNETRTEEIQVWVDEVGHWE